MPKSIAINRNSQSDRIAALCGMIWFALIIDACYTWFLPDVVRDILGNLFVLFGTVILASDNGIKLTENKRGKILSIIILLLFLLLTHRTVLAFLVYVPLICVMVWRESAWLRMYDYFKRFVIFYAILSIIVEILVISRFWLILPRLATFPAQDQIQENLGYVNYFYGIFCVPAPDTSITFYRACGPLREGGHFVFFLGFVYFVEKMLYDRRNKWLIVCGVLTLSPNFVIFFLLSEVYCAIKKNQIMKPLLSILGIIVSAIVVFILSPQSLQDEVIRIVYERMLEASIENMQSEGAMALLDGRVEDYGVAAYNQFAKSGLYELMTGVQSFDGYNLMSDYRWMLMSRGYIGTSLVLWITYKFSCTKKIDLFGICVFLFALAIFVQRAWMYRHVYIWIMMLLVVNKAYFCKQQTVCQNH